MEREAFWDRLFALDVREMSETEQLYFAVNEFLCEWANGSLSQYFYNSGGERVVLLDRGLTGIGATKTAAIMREARRVVFDGEEPSHPNLPWPLANHKQAELNALSNRIGAEENDVWSRLDAFAVAQGLYVVERAD